MAETTNQASPSPTNGHSILPLGGFDTHGTFSGSHQKTDGFVNMLSGLNPKELSKEERDVLLPLAKQIVDMAAKTKSSVKPGKMYVNLFGSQEQNSQHSTFAPQSVIGLLQKKVQGANTRIQNRKAEINDYRQVLKTGVMKTKGGVQRLTPVTRKTIQQKKLHAEAALVEAVGDLIVFRAQFEEALQKNNAPVKESIKSVREQAYIRRTAPSISQQIIQYVENKTGVKEQLINLKREPESGSVQEKFLAALEGSDTKTYKLLADKPKLATQVRQRVMEYVTANK